MSTLETKKELHQIIDNSDTNLAEEFYDLSTTYICEPFNAQLYGFKKVLKY